MTLPTPQTRADLDDMICTCGGEHKDDHITILQAACHPTSPALVTYTSHDGCIILSCTVCKRGYARIQVAWMVPS